MTELLNSDVIEKVIYIVLAIFIPTLIYFIVKMYINHRTKGMKRGKHLTYLRLFRSCTKYLMIIASILAILQIIGVDTVSILTGLGIVSVIAGLALQDALKDIIMGFNIIADNYFAVGDIVEVNNIVGRVVEIGFKATKIKNLTNQNIEVIGNRNISSATVYSPQLDIDLSLPYEKSLTEVEACLNNILAKIKTMPDVDDANYLGIQKFDDSAIIYKLRFSVKPELQPQVSRNIRCKIKSELDKAGIAIPYPQLDIHNIK